MHSSELTRLLKSVGQRVFVTYYRDFANPELDTADLAGILAQEGFTDKACRSRATHARSIFNRGLQVQALEVIAASTRGGNEKTARMASDLLTQLRSEGQSAGIDGDEAAALVPVASEVLENEDTQEDEVVISIVPLSAATAIDDARLTEIKDSTVIARIAQAVPALAEAAARTAGDNALKSMEVYKAILPAGEALAKSQTMEGAFRGFARAGTASNSPFSAHANFVKVDPSKSTAFASTAVNTLNVVSLVVGQYHMSEINRSLRRLAEGVDAIVGLLKRERKGDIISLIAHVEKISHFSSEIMGDEMQRNVTLSALQNLERDCTRLLGQVNLDMHDIIGNAEPSYKTYEQSIGNLAGLLEEQAALIVVLREVGELTYLLGRGATSSEQAYFHFNNYVQQSVQARARLAEWQKRQLRRLRIDLAKERRYDAGRAYGHVVLYTIVAFGTNTVQTMSEEDCFKKLKPSLVREVRNQLNAAPESKGDLIEVYDQDVEIIIKDGNYYYLHEPPCDD